MNNLKKSIEKDYKDVQDLILLEKYSDAIDLMYGIIQKLVTSQMDDACLVSKSFEKDLDVLYVTKLIEKGTYDNYTGIISLYNMKHDGKMPPDETIRLGADILKNEVDYAVRRTITPQQEDVKSGSYEGNIDFPLNNKKEDASNGYDENNEVYYDYNPGINNNIDENMYDTNSIQNGMNMANMNNYVNDQNNTNYQNGVDYNTYNNLQYNNMAYNTEDIFNRNASMDVRTKRPINIANIKRLINVSNLLKIMTPLICIIILILVVRGMFTNNESQILIETTEAIVYNNETEYVEQTVETTAPSVAGTYIVTGDTVNLRNEPSNTSRIYARINKNVEVQVIRFYDADWALIEYDGRNLYISRNYIQKQE